VELAAAHSRARVNVNPGRRVSAFLIDHLIWFVSIGVLVWLLLPWLTQPDRTDLELDLTLAACFFAVPVLQWGLLAATGQSIGKRLLGLRIVQMDDGGPPGFVRAVVFRCWVSDVIYCLPVIGLILFILSALAVLGPKRRTLHDRVAGTTLENVR
jgi:uncharacterized RDD family membrane protein YckC